MDKLFNLDGFFPKNLSSSSEIVRLDDAVFIKKGKVTGKHIHVKRRLEI